MPSHITPATFIHTKAHFILPYLAKPGSYVSSLPYPTRLSLTLPPHILLTQPPYAIKSHPAMPNHAFQYPWVLGLLKAEVLKSWGLEMPTSQGYKILKCTCHRAMESTMYPKVPCYRVWGF